MVTGFSNFLDFMRSSSLVVSPGFQLGLTVAVTILGILVCLAGLLANFGSYERILLAFVPLQILFAVLNSVCFVLTAMVTERYPWFGALLAFTLIAILAAFGSALAATKILTMPLYISSPARSAVVQ